MSDLNIHEHCYRISKGEDNLCLSDLTFPQHGIPEHLRGGVNPVFLAVCLGDVGYNSLCGQGERLIRGGSLIGRGHL